MTDLYISEKPETTLSLKCNMDLSIIIPVWNEQNKIDADLQALDTFFAEHNTSVEVIVVDDGSNDATCTVVDKVRKNLDLTVKLLCEGGHHGKGYAVRKGILASRGKYVMFMDCGGNVPLEYINKGLELLSDPSIRLVHGSRRLPESRIPAPMSFKRRILSGIFRVAARFFLDLPSHLTDTQCGFKLYQGETARELYRDPTIDGFLFDLEIILRARKAGHRIRELPVEWHWDPDSRLQPERIYGQILRDMLYLKRSY